MVCFVESFFPVSSTPSHIAVNRNAASSTELVTGPIQSKDDAYDTRPCLLTNPKVGFNPTTPQNEAGCLMLPPVSLPRAATHCPDATAAALPPLLPPGTRDKSHGFFVLPVAPVPVVLPIPNSSMFVLPSKTHPAFFSCVNTVASYGLLWFARSLDPAVVNPSVTQMLSLIAMGIPARGPSFSPRVRAWSTALALANAPTPVTETKLPSFSLDFARVAR
mmetsp:Transcript_793/g.3061  ORF Transcript_793/g.3061 Transcript_793/m.3061 type:complete len:219 (+) Transcript_793:827-1483(+)